MTEVTNQSTPTWTDALGVTRTPEQMGTGHLLNVVGLLFDRFVRESAIVTDMLDELADRGVNGVWRWVYEDADELIPELLQEQADLAVSSHGKIKSLIANAEMDYQARRALRVELQKVASRQADAESEVYALRLELGRRDEADKRRRARARKAKK